MSMLVCTQYLVCAAIRLIDLAGSEKATAGKEWMKEGKYINTRSVPQPLRAYETSQTMATSTRTLVKLTHVGKRDLYLSRERCSSWYGSWLVRVRIHETVEPRD